MARDHESVQDTIGKLHDQLGVFRKRNRRLLTTAIILAVILLMIGVKLYTSYVLQYAVLADVRMEQSGDEPRQIVFYYTAVVPGLVEFLHGGARLTSHVDKGKSQVSWRWHNNGAVKIRIRYRRWLFPVWDTEVFHM
jgi:hypothetical protein